MLRPFAHPVACCCAMFETGQTFSQLETDATTPNIVGPTMLGVVASVCSQLYATSLRISFCPGTFAHGFVRLPPRVLAAHWPAQNTFLTCRDTQLTPNVNLSYPCVFFRRENFPLSNVADRKLSRAGTKQINIFIDVCRASLCKAIGNKYKAHKYIV